MANMIAGSEPTIMAKSQLFYVPPTITERMSTYDVLIGPNAATFDEANDISFDIARVTIQSPGQIRVVRVTSM